MPRADIYWLHAYSQKHSIGDLVMRHPQATDAAAPCASKPGTAAEEAYAGKLAKYQSRWRFPADEFVPLAMETGGRLHPEFRHFLRRFAFVALGSADKYSELTKEERAKYSANIRHLLTSVSVAAARTTGLSLLYIKDACAAVRVPGAGVAEPTQEATQAASGASGSASTQALEGQGSGGPMGGPQEGGQPVGEGAPVAAGQ